MEIPFKHGHIQRNGDFEEFSIESGVVVSDEIKEYYGEWNGGSVDGFHVYKINESQLILIEYFLCFRGSINGLTSEDSLYWLRNQPNLLRRKENGGGGFIPFAIGEVVRNMNSKNGRKVLLALNGMADGNVVIVDIVSGAVEGLGISFGSLIEQSSIVDFDSVE